MANGITLGNRYRWSAQMELSKELENRYERLANMDVDYEH